MAANINDQITSNQEHTYTENEGSQNYENGDDSNAALNKGVFVPINAVINIFSFLTPDELLVAMRVCRVWYNVIHTHRKQMQEVSYKVLALSTNSEFTIHAVSKDRIYKYACQKYFRDHDNELREAHAVIRTRRDYLYNYPCFISFHPSVPRYYTSAEAWNHSVFCTVRRDVCYDHPYLKPMLTSSPRSVPTGSKLYTPPMVWYENLDVMTRFAHVKTISLTHFSFTMTTGYMIAKHCKPFRLTNLILHNVNCKAINGKEFQNILTDVFPAENYTFEGVSKTLPNHFDANWLNHPTTLQAKNIHFTPTLSRFRTNPACFVKFAITEKELQDFLCHPNAPKNREVFQFHVCNVDFDPGFENRLQRFTRNYCPTGFEKIVIHSNDNAQDGRRQVAEIRNIYFQEQLFPHGPAHNYYLNGEYPDNV